MNLIFLPAVFFFAAITAYEDIALSKIRNKWIISGLAYSFSAYILLYFLSFLRAIDYGGVNYAYLKDYLLNFWISVFAAYALWKFNAWASGDAKLFILYSALIPLHFYSKGYINYFPSAILLFNIFIPLFLAIVIAAPFKLLGVLVSLLRSRDRLREALGRVQGFFKDPAPKVKGIFSKNMASLPAYLLIFCGLQYAMRGSGLNPAWIAVVLLLSLPLIQIIKKNPKALLLAVIAVSGFFGHRIIYGQGLKEIPALFWQILKIFSLFWALRLFLAAYVKYTQVKKIEINQLQPSMLPSEGAVKVIEGFPQDLKQRIGPVYPDGLSQEQAAIIQESYREKGMCEIEVYRTFPFAIWILLGAAVTLVFRQSVFTVLFPGNF